MSSLRSSRTSSHASRKSHLSGRFINSILVLMLLSAQTPAAPQVLTSVVQSWHLSTVFWLQGSGWTATLQGLANRQPAPALRAQEKQEERDARAARIQITPENATLLGGQPVFFTATAFDKDEAPVGGVRFTWQTVGGERGANSPITDNGYFSAERAGTYHLKVEGAGKTAITTVTVLDGPEHNGTAKPRVTVREVHSHRSPPMEMSKSTAAPESMGRTDGRRGRAVFTKASYAHAPAPGNAASAMVPLEPGEWNDDNSWSAAAPLNRRGNPPNFPSDHGGSSSGNYQLAAPVVSLPGRKIDLNLNLIYNSRVWNKAGADVTFDIDRDNVAPGWSLGFGKLVSLGSEGDMLVDADGTRHPFKGTRTETFWTDYSYVRYDLYTTDGTFIKYSTNRWVNRGTQPVPTHFLWAFVSYPDGTVASSDYTGAVTDRVIYLRDIKERNDNRIIMTFSPNRSWYSPPPISYITDSLGRTLQFHYDTNNPGLLTAITAAGLKDANNNVVTRTLMRLHYKLHNLQQNNSYGFNTALVNPQARASSVYLIDAIYYPSTNTGYWFGASDSFSPYGMIAKVEEQRGMSFTTTTSTPLKEQGTVVPGVMTTRQVYNYPLAFDNQLTDAPTFTRMTSTWAYMDVSVAPETIYTIDNDASPRRVQITRPDGTYLVQLSYNYSNLAESNPNKVLDGSIYQKSLYDANNRLLGRTVIDWEIGDSYSPRMVRVQETDERGQKVKTEYGYNGSYNQVTEVREYGYGPATTPFRITQTAYNNITPQDAWERILGLPTLTEVFEGNGTTRLKRTEYYYEPYYAPGVEVTMNSKPSPYNINQGNVTKLIQYAGVSATTLTNPVIQTYQYDFTGNLIKVSPVCANNTVCEESRATYNSTTQYAYLTSQVFGAPGTNTAGQVTTAATYDFNTGLILSATSANGRARRSEYFTDSWRVKEIIQPTNARTTYAYDDSALKVTETTSTAPLPGGLIAAQGTRYINGLGQPWQEETLNPHNGLDVVQTKYDAIGRMWQQTRPYRAGETQQWKEFFYDVLDRVIKVKAPNGDLTETFYNESTYPGAATQNVPGQTTRAKDQWGRERWSRTDSQGRLVEVVEPNPLGSGSVYDAGGQLTSYSYDTLNNLIQIQQGSQTRAFRYDALGRLTRQKLAEASATINDAGTHVGIGATGAQWSDAFTYDERSNLIGHVDARGVNAAFSYLDATQNPDPLNRLLSVSYTRPANSTIPLAAAVTYAYRTLGNKTQVETVRTADVSTETYRYDSEGRAYEKELTLDSRSSYPIITTYTFDSLDRITDTTYPAQVLASQAQRKVVHHEYNEAGRLKKLQVGGTDYASNITYNAASQIKSLSIGPSAVNQLNESYDYDPATGLVAGQKVYRGTDPLQNQLLNLSYDYVRPGTNAGRTGQLTKVTDNLNPNKGRSFEYDGLGRLQRASAGGTAGTWAQRYLYDRFGNRINTLSLKTDQFVANLYYVTLNRAPDGTGLQDWDGYLRPYYSQGPAQFLAAAKIVAGGFFGSQEYVNRNRSNSEYVYDLYRTYLNREPDQGGWDAWTNALNNGASRQLVQQGFADSSEFANTVSGMYPGATTSRVNVAATDNGGVATASSVYPYGSYPASSVNNGDRKGVNWGSGGGWNDATLDAYPDWVQVDFNGSKTISEIDVFTCQDNYSNPSQPSEGQNFTLYGITAFQVQYWNGSNWLDVPGGNVTGNNKIWRKFTFTPLTTTKIRVLVNNSLASYSRIVEIEAYQAVSNATSSTPVPRDGWGYVSIDPGTNRINAPGWEYDAAGNQTRVLAPSGNWQRYEYDTANRLTKVKDDYYNTLASYTYGDDNVRLMAEEGVAPNATRTYYASDHGTVLAEYVENYTGTVPQWAMSYFYLEDRLLATHEPGSGGADLVRYQHPNRLGTQLVTNASDGSSFEQMTLPFGPDLWAESGSMTKRHFTSYDRSGMTGLDYAVNRHYDSMQGRFTQIDPLGIEAASLTNPQTLNMYAYCGNDPINNTDPDGLFGFFFPSFFSFGISFGFGGGVPGFGIRTVINNYYGQWFNFGGAAAPAARPAAPPAAPPPPPTTSSVSSGNSASSSSQTASPSVSCPVIRPSDPVDKMVFTALWGEVSTVGDHQYGTDQWGSKALGHPNGRQLTQTDIYVEAVHMLMVLMNRVRVWPEYKGKTIADAAVANNQVLGLKLSNMDVSFGNVGDQSCFRAGALTSALGWMHTSGDHLLEDPVKSKLFFWRGVPQWSEKWVRKFNPGDIRYANTDFMEKNPEQPKPKKRKK